MKLLNELDVADQLRLYLKIARSGIINGKIGPAQLAAEQAVRLSKDGSVEGARSKLYKAATLILSSSLDKGLGELQGLDGSRLPKHDAELREAVASLAKQISKGPEGSPQSLGPEPSRAASLAPGGPSASAATLIEAAQGAIGQAEELLHGSAR